MTQTPSHRRQGQIDNLLQHNDVARRAPNHRGGRGRQRASSGHGTPTRQPSHPGCPRRRASNHLSPLLATHPRGNTRGSPQDPNTNLPPPDAAWKSNNPLNTRKTHRLRITEYQTGIARPAEAGGRRNFPAPRPDARQVQRQVRPSRQALINPDPAETR